MVKKLRSEAENPDYTLVVNRTQGRIMAYVHAAAHPVSRGRLADALGSSRTKVSAEVSNLVDLGLLAEEGLAESDGGRRSNLLGIPRSAGLVAAVDLGATSIDVALTTLGSGIVAHRGETADIQDGPKPVLKRAKTMLSGLLHEQGDEPKDVLAIGIGVPGPVEQAAGVLRSPPIISGCCSRSPSTMWTTPGSPPRTVRTRSRGRRMLLTAPRIWLEPYARRACRRKHNG